jgi:hypothetical protein
VEQFEPISERHILEGMNPAELTAYSLHLGVIVTKIETAMNMVAEVLDGYGTTVEEQMNLPPRT